MSIFNHYRDEDRDCESKNLERPLAVGSSFNESIAPDWRSNKEKILDMWQKLSDKEKEELLKELK